MTCGDFDSENGALALMCAALMGARYEWTGHDSAKADGYIVLADGAEIEVDVAKDASETFMSRVARAARQKGLIELTPGSGFWNGTFDSRSSIADINKNAQGLIDDIVASGQPLGPHNSVAIEHMGGGIWVDTLQRVGDAPDQLEFRVHELASVDRYFIDTSPDSIGQYAQEYIEGAGSPRSSAHRDKKFENLARRARENGRQAHFALIATFPKNSGVWHALTRLQLGATWDYELPREPLGLPAGIHGLWVLYPDFRVTVAYLEDRAWFRSPP